MDEKQSLLYFGMALIISHNILTSSQQINELEEISTIWMWNCKAELGGSYTPKQKETLHYVSQDFVPNLMLFNTFTKNSAEWSIYLLNVQRHKVKQIKTVSIQNNIAWRNDTKNFNKEWSEAVCCSKNNYLNPQRMRNNWLEHSSSESHLGSHWIINQTKQ